MSKSIYFGLVGGGTITQFELGVAARINGEKLNIHNDKAVREYAAKCPGITKEIEHPSIKYLLTHGNKRLAIKVYYDRYRNKGITFKQAKDKVNAFELKLKEEKSNDSN